MIIIINRKKKQFSEEFKNVENFIDFLKLKNVKLNYNNSIIIDKIYKVYINFTNNPGVLTNTDFKPSFYDEFGLKNRNSFSYDG